MTLDPLETVSYPADHANRERLRTDHDRTFFVEAGAGTGKTTTLVSRIVALVASDRLCMERLAAITFTEAAAAELKERVRRALEDAVSDESRSEAERACLTRAVSQVDLASIQTIHAFAGSLLRTYPIEAGLPPGFSTWDDIQTRIDFAERFRTWLYDEVPVDSSEGRAGQEAIRRALLLGMTFDNVRRLAEVLQEQSDLLSPTTTWAVPDLPNARNVANAVGPKLLALEGLIHLARNGEDDKLVREIRRLRLAATRLAEARDEVDALAAMQEVGSIKATVGAMKDWDVGPDRMSPVRPIKAVLADAKTAIEETLVSHRRSALVAILHVVRDLTLAYEAERRQAGVATFHDLLTWARDLLRDDEGLRRRAQRQFSCIFVDEFQDTDPLQAEIAWSLAADPEVGFPPDWRDATIVPGRLFVVGDPKQSIYRFRRADIGLYGRIYGRASEDQKAPLTQNFRSVGPILRFVNRYFGREMRELAGVQAPYVDLQPSRPAGGPGGVYPIGGKIAGRAADVHAGEAHAVAAAARFVVDTGLSVRDGKLWRPARFADVCVLLPTRTNVRRLEDALERFKVPYRVEGGSLVLSTPEVRDLLSCLRAIDDPSDQVALVAALRSSAYACSDVDLLAWVERGGRFDYEDRRDNLDGLVAEAMASLRALHALRADRSTAATIDAFIRERMLAIQAFGQPRPREAWRRLRYVVGQARRLAAAGRPSLRSLVDWLDDLAQAQFRDPESPLPEADEDAVRLMTVHASKGLEFPIVVMTGLGSPHRGRTETVRVIADRDIGTLEVGIGAFTTGGYEVLKEREKLLDEAEQIRLLYVAATRARDHLVLCLHHADPKVPAARIVDLLAGADPPQVNPLDVTLDEPGADRSTGQITESLTPDEHAQDEREWQRNRAALIGRFSKIAVVTATDLARKRISGIAAVQSPLPLGEGQGEGVPRSQSDEFPGDAVDGATEDISESLPIAPSVASGDPGNALTLALSPWEREGIRGPAATPPPEADFLFDDKDNAIGDDDSEGLPSAIVEDRATVIGRAVHAALAAIDAGASEPDAIRGVTLNRNLRERARDVQRLVGAVRSCPAYRRATATARHWHEVPVGVEIGGVLLEGRIDLLWERTDGTLGILDVKTDQVDSSTIEGRANDYRAQVGAYALAVQEVTRKRVSIVEFVFAALGGQVVRFEQVEALVDEARELIAAGSP